jgi:hypothetical protein
MACSSKFLHLLPSTILHSTIHDQNSLYNLKNTLFYKCWGKLGSILSIYTLAISKHQVPLLALDVYLAAVGEMQLTEYSFYVKMEGRNVENGQQNALKCIFYFM